MGDTVAVDKAVWGAGVLEREQGGEHADLDGKEGDGCMKRSLGQEADRQVEGRGEEPCQPLAV